ncbi:hypothetical protein V8E52_006734 [Russula decolorans]
MVPSYIMHLRLSFSVLRVSFSAPFLSPECLKEMLTRPDQRPICLVMDALDRSPKTSGIRSPRKMVLQPVMELVELHLPNLRICVTSRPEIDIRDVFEPLTSHRMSLHDRSG